MTDDFNQLNLHPLLAQAVAEHGYIHPTPIQASLIPVMLTGRDVIGQAQTGTGKTAAFALPMLQNLLPNQHHVQGLVLVPTRELALQVGQAIAAYGRHLNARVLPIYGGQSYGAQIGQLRRGVDVVVGTPGRLIDLMERGVLDISQVASVVLDEADEMLSMGFIEEIETILARTPDQRQTALFSATLPVEIRRLADQYMTAPQSIAIQGEPVTVEAIEQRHYLVHHTDKLAALTRLFETEDISRALIFVRTRTETSDFANELTVRGYPAEALSGDLSQDARERTVSRFRQDQIKVLVATDVAARGLDIEGISHVFQYNLPDDPEIYVHRIGRTGRAGATGIAITLVAPSEKRRLAQVEAFTRRKIPRAALPSEEDIRRIREERLLGQVVVWLKRGRCLQERALVQQLVDQGYDPLEIAAAALKLTRASEKQRPIAPVSDVQERRPAAERERHGPDARRELHPAGRSNSHEAGMVRLSLNMGRRHGIGPNDIVRAIAHHAEIPGSSIGKIFIEEKRSLVDVPERFAQQVLARNGEVMIRQYSIHVRAA